MTISEAINAMRSDTKLGKSFSFVFASYNQTDQTTQGIIEVKRAKLRNRGSKDFNKNQEVMENYLDLDTNEPRWFYHPLLMFYNGQKLDSI
jgi:hypothetical protein